MESSRHLLLWFCPDGSWLVCSSRPSGLDRWTQTKSRNQPSNPSRRSPQVPPVGAATLLMLLTDGLDLNLRSKVERRREGVPQWLGYVQTGSQRFYQFHLSHMVLSGLKRLRRGCALTLTAVGRFHSTTRRLGLNAIPARSLAAPSQTGTCFPVPPQQLLFSLMGSVCLRVNGLFCFHAGVWPSHASSRLPVMMGDVARADSTPAPRPNSTIKLTNECMSLAPATAADKRYCTWPPGGGSGLEIHFHC